MARKLAVVFGIGWMAIVGLLGLWLGIRETFLNAPGLIFQGGYGDIYILAIAFAPGYFLYGWGKQQSRSNKVA